MASQVKSQAQPQDTNTTTKLRKVTCSVYNKEIVHLKRDLINIHKWDNKDARLARQNLELRLQKKPKKSPKEKICPYEKCGKVVKCLKYHLRQTH